LYAEKFSGKDAGEKIANCIAALPQGGGVCDARSFSGEQRSASGFTVGSATKPVELLLGAIDLMVAKPIYIQAKSSIAGLPSSQGIGMYQGATLIKAADQSNMPVVVEILGPLAVLQDVTVDGNRTRNSGDAAAVRVNSANRSNLFRVTAQNAPGNGIEIYSKRASDSCCAKLQQVMAIHNGRSGLAIIATGDVFISLSEFEENDGHGIEIDGGAGNRLQNSDIGGNRGDGLFLHGSRPLPASNNIIMGNQFGNNYQADLAIAGWEHGPSGNGNLIIGNEFVGGIRRDGGKFEAIRIVDSGQNVIANNSFFAGKGHHYRSCVTISGAHQMRDQVTNNYCLAEQAGGDAGFVVTQNTQTVGNQGNVHIK
jgi:hypothetical protein